MADNHAGATSNSNPATVTDAYASADNANSHPNGNADATSYAYADSNVSDLASLPYGDTDANPDAYMSTLAVPYADFNTVNAFNAIAFSILMDHHREGSERANPSYVTEKLIEFENFSETHAVAMLDHRNQARLRNWCRYWNYPVPKELETWLQEKMT